MLLKCYTWHVKFGKLNNGHRTGKGQSSFQPQRRAMPENVQITVQLYSSHASKVLLKILQARLQQYVNQEIPHVQVGFWKGRRIRDQIANIHWVIEEEIEFQKKIIYFCFIDYTQAFDCVDHNKLWMLLKEMGIPRPPYLSSEIHKCRLWSNSYIWTLNNWLVQNWSRDMSGLFIVTLLI